MMDNSELPACQFRSGHSREFCYCVHPQIAISRSPLQVLRAQCLRCDQADDRPHGGEPHLFHMPGGPARLQNHETNSDAINGPAFGATPCSPTRLAEVQAGPAADVNSAKSIPTVSQLHVLTCLFNPARSRKIVRNYHTFRQSLGDVPITVVELTLDDDPAIDSEALHIRGRRDRHCLWQKERLLNLGLESLPADVDAVAWLDADILLPSAWYEQTLAALQQAWVIQPYSWAHWLDEEQRVEHSFCSFSKWRGERSEKVYGHPGFGWAAHREVLKHGFFDRHIVGGGDAWMCYAFDGDRRPVRWPSPPAPTWLIEEYDLWAERTTALVKGQMQFLSSDLIHLNHGKHSERRYHERAHWMMQTHLQSRHIVLDDNGLYTVQGNEPFRKKMIDYFPARRDGS